MVKNRRSITCRLALALLSLAALQGQQAKLLSIPLDPDKVELRIDPQHSRPDGSQFLLLVSPDKAATPKAVLKYIATRSDLVTWTSQQGKLLLEAMKAADKRVAILRAEQQALLKKGAELQTSVEQASDALQSAKATEAKLKKKVQQPAATGGATPDKSGTNNPATSTTPETTPGADATSGAPATHPKVAAEPPPKAEDVILETAPKVPILTLPVPATATLTMNSNPAHRRADGSMFELFVNVGGVNLDYLAMREDAVSIERQQLRSLQLYAEDSDKLISVIQTENRLLSEKNSELDAEAHDLRRAAQLAQQNLDTLAQILNAQKRRWWEVLLETLPVLASVIGLAVK